jgi:UDP-glucose 4-epimerase
MFNGQTILITGGTGSFGNAAVEQFLKTDIKEIRIFSRDEKKQEDMRESIRDSRVRFYIGDVRDSASLIAPMLGVDFVFHASALKQVPTCEFFPLEAIMTNSVGAENVFNAAIDAGVKVVVALSSDKAVYPACAMGMSKGLMEKLMAAKARANGHTKFCATRFGNVLGSRGSVVPLFIKQIKSGQQVTITDPNMTRFMMTMDDAVTLVMVAFTLGTNGDTFVHKDKATTVGILARAVQQIFNDPQGARIVGARHGEKIYETLLTREERVRAIDQGQYFRIPLDSRDLNYSLYTTGNGGVDDAEYNSHNVYRMTLEETVDLLSTLDCVHDALRG